MNEKVAVLRYAFSGGEPCVIRVPAGLVREKASALYASGALYVTRRGKLIKRHSRESSNV